MPPPSLLPSDKLSVCACYNSQVSYYGKRELSIVRHHIASIHLTKLCMLPWIWVDWLLHLALWCLHLSFFNSIYNTVRYFSSIYLPTHTTTCHLLSLFFSFSFGVFFCVLSCLGHLLLWWEVLPLSVSVVRPSIHHPSIHAGLFQNWKCNTTSVVTVRLSQIWSKKRQGLFLWWEYERLYGTVLVPDLPAQSGRFPHPLSCSFKWGVSEREWAGGEEGREKNCFFRGQEGRGWSVMVQV